MSARAPDEGITFVAFTATYSHPRADGLPTFIVDPDVLGALAGPALARGLHVGAETA